MEAEVEAEVEEKTEFKFSELGDRAKERAREEYAGRGYLDYDWWDFVYEDFITVAACLGFETSSRETQFSGFCSQGDGACFAGVYNGFDTNATQGITDHCADEELLRIAATLDVLAVGAKLKWSSYWTSVIDTRDNYSHSGTMNANATRVTHVDDDDVADSDAEEAEEVIQQAARDLADWLYGQLESEHDWLHSAECIDPHLDDLIFDEDGVLI